MISLGDSIRETGSGLKDAFAQASSLAALSQKMRDKEKFKAEIRDQILARAGAKDPKEVSRINSVIDSIDDPRDLAQMAGAFEASMRYYEESNGSLPMIPTFGTDFNDYKAIVDSIVDGKKKAADEEKKKRIAGAIRSEVSTDTPTRGEIVTGAIPQPDSGYQGKGTSRVHGLGGRQKTRNEVLANLAEQRFTSDQINDSPASGLIHSLPSGDYREPAEPASEKDLAVADYYRAGAEQRRSGGSGGSGGSGSGKGNSDDSLKRMEDKVTKLRAEKQRYRAIAASFNTKDSSGPLGEVANIDKEIKVLERYITKENKKKGIDLSEFEDIPQPTDEIAIEASRIKEKLAAIGKDTNPIFLASEIYIFAKERNIPVRLEAIKAALAKNYRIEDIMMMIAEEGVPHMGGYNAK